jgi:hypothetical protein
MSEEETPARPMLRVVRGEATPEEVVALLAVLAARSASPEPAPRPQQSPWTYRRAQLSKPIFVGHGEWRRSGWDNGTRTKADW